MIMYQCSL